jgi:hypothetical protein
MSDRFTGRYYIGGTVSMQQFVRILELFDKEGVDEIILGDTLGGVFCEASWGKVGSITNLCVSEKIQCLHATDAYYEYPESIDVVTKDGRHLEPMNSEEGSIVVSIDSIRQKIKGLLEVDKISLEDLPTHIVGDTVANKYARARMEGYKESAFQFYLDQIEKDYGEYNYPDDFEVEGLSDEQLENITLNGKNHLAELEIVIGSEALNELRSE